MRSLILYFFLLLLRIPLNLGLDIGHKRSRFPKILSKKGLEFIPSKGSGNVAFDLSLVLLPAEIDLIPEEQDRKWDALGARGTGRVEMIFALSTKGIVHYVRATIV